MLPPTGNVLVRVSERDLGADRRVENTGRGLCCPDAPGHFRRECHVVGHVDRLVAADVLQYVVGAARLPTAGCPSTNYYTDVWKAAKAFLNTCEVFTLGLDDGTAHAADFEFSR